MAAWLAYWRPLCSVTLAGIALATGALAASKAPPPAPDRKVPPGSFADAPNGEGVSRTLTTARAFDANNPFFRPLGTNGRACATCHPVGQGMTVTPEYASRVFDATQGLDPLFAAVDGANAPDLDLSTAEARRANCSMLLTKGLFRIGLPVPAGAEFTLAAVDDPYGYASARDLSCFRRPLPATNLRFLATVMWDGRELAGQDSVRDALASQVVDAVLGHMQAAAPPSAAQIGRILDFETGLYTAQVYDKRVGRVDTAQIGAGPSPLARLPFWPGANDAFGFVRGSGRRFDPDVFPFYEDWLPRPAARPGAGLAAARQSVARGERLFNTRRFVISGVAGLNDVLGRPRITGTCSSCHSTPGVGGNALPLLLNTGIADAVRRTPDLPLYMLRNTATGETVQTTDPGAAMTTGRWADIGKFKVPGLRGLETRSPYMHNGFSGDLTDVLDFYDGRFGIGLTPQEKADLRAFLVTL